MEISIIPIGDLKQLIRAEVKDAIIEASSERLSGTPDGSQEIVKRSDVAGMFGVSLVTVHDWMSKGILPHYKMNGRTYFKRSEVLQAMKQVRIRRKTY